MTKETTKEIKIGDKIETIYGEKREVVKTEEINKKDKFGVKRAFKIILTQKGDNLCWFPIEKIK